MKILNQTTGTGALVKKFFRFIIPSILSMLTFSIYTMVDGIFVARGVGEKALAAVNLSSPYNSAMFAFGMLIAVGMATVIGMELGRGRQERASELFTQNLLVSALAAFVITAVTLLNLRSIAEFLGATEDTLDHVMEYVGTVSPFAVFFICAYNMEILIKTDGTPVISLIGVGMAGLTNVVLDWFFVMILGWGVRGAAFATGLAQITSVVLYLVYFTRFSRVLCFRRFRWDKAIYKKTIPLGVGDGITEFSNGIVIFLFNRAILKLLGEDGVVSYTVIGYVNTLVLMMMSGTAQGMQPICSFHYGRGEWENCRLLRNLGLLTGALFGIAGWTACALGGGMIVSLFLEKNSPLFGATVAALQSYSWAFLVMGINVVGGAFFTSVCRVSMAFPISLGRGLVLPVLSVAFVFLTGQGSLIWYAGFMAEGLCLVMTLCFLRMSRKSTLEISV